MMPQQVAWGLSQAHCTTERSFNALAEVGADRLYYRLEHVRNLKLLIGPVGGEGCQQAVTVAVDAEHGGG